jgi:hypothetical protein
MSSRIWTLLVLVVLLALSGCGTQSSTHAHRGPATGTRLPVITPMDGAMAVFRAKVGPILCEYARNLESSEQATARTAQNADGAISASAPESVQSEYASMLHNFANMLRATVGKFRAVSPPAQIAGEYTEFISSLRSMTAAASQAAGYAAAHNYAEIAAMENIATPSAGEGVFKKAGITDC